MVSAYQLTKLQATVLNGPHVTSLSSLLHATDNVHALVASDRDGDDARSLMGGHEPRFRGVAL